MKIIFMGTPEIAVPSLKALKDDGYEIPLVITQADKPKGRGNVMLPTPVKEYAQSVGLEVYQPEKIRGNAECLEKIKACAPDLFAVVAYGKILPKEILDIPKIAPINVHFSLLPAYRGAAPVNWAIINGDKTTGVSTMLMDIGMDTGDILLMKETEIKSKNAEELSAELSLTGADLLIKTIKNFDIITPLKQDDSKVSIAPMIKKEDGCINWEKSAIDIERLIRGFQPWPTAYSKLEGKFVKFFNAEVSDVKSKTFGTVIEVDKDSFTISTGEGSLKIKELQLEGKKRLDVRSFLAGFNITIGMCFE